MQGLQYLVFLTVMNLTQFRSRLEIPPLHVELHHRHQQPVGFVDTWSPKQIKEIMDIEKRTLTALEESILMHELIDADSWVVGALDGKINKVKKREWFGIPKSMYPGETEYIKSNPERSFRIGQGWKKHG